MLGAPPCPQGGVATTPGPEEGVPAAGIFSWKAEPHPPPARPPLCPWLSHSEALCEGWVSQRGLSGSPLHGAVHLVAPTPWPALGTAGGATSLSLPHSKYSDGMELAGQEVGMVKVSSPQAGQSCRLPGPRSAFPWPCEEVQGAAVCPASPA